MLKDKISSLKYFLCIICKEIKICKILISLLKTTKKALTKMSKFLGKYAGFIGFTLFILIVFVAVFNVIGMQEKIEKDFDEYTENISIFDNIDIEKKQKIISFIKQDLSIIFANQNFINICSDLDYIINTNLLDKKGINYNISISNNLKESKNYGIEAIQATLSRLDKIKYLSEEFETKYHQSLGIFHVIPNSSKCILSGYTVNTNTQSIYFLTNNNKSEIIQNKNKFISIELENRKMFFEKENLFKHYNELFSNIYEINNLINLKTTNVLKDFIVSFYISYSSYFLLIVTVIGLIGSAAVVWFLGKNNLYLEMINKEEKLIEKETKLTNREKDLTNKEMKVRKLEHTLSHDIKTNLNQNLIELEYLYNNEGATPDLKRGVLSIYARDLMVKNANDVGKIPLNLYQFPSSFYQETFIKFFNEESAEIEQDIFNEFFIFKEHNKLAQFNKYTVIAESLNPNKAFYENELSSILFKLLNNALKYAKLSEKIIIELSKDDNTICSISNIIIDEEDLDIVEFNINTAIESEQEYRNLFLTQTALKKYNLELKVRTNSTLNQITVDVIRGL